VISSIRIRPPAELYLRMKYECSYVAQLLARDESIVPAFPSSPACGSASRTRTGGSVAGKAGRGSSSALRTVQPNEQAAESTPPSFPDPVFGCIYTRIWLQHLPH
jgi:hypothetical protein